MNQVLERESTSSTDTQKLVHFIQCHDEDVAMCGMDVSSLVFTEGPASCVVCVDLEEREQSEPLCACNCCGGFE